MNVVSEKCKFPSPRLLGGSDFRRRRARGSSLKDNEGLPEACGQRLAVNETIEVSPCIDAHVGSADLRCNRCSERMAEDRNPRRVHAPCKQAGRIGLVSTLDLVQYEADVGRTNLHLMFGGRDCFSERFITGIVQWFAKHRPGLSAIRK